MVRWRRYRLAEVGSDDDDDDDDMADSMEHQTIRAHLSPAPALIAILCKLDTGSSLNTDLKPD